MVGRNLMLLVFQLFFILLFCEQTYSECRQLTACSCMFSNGQGYNLSSLANSRSLTAVGGNHTFYFHPCTNIPLSNNKSSPCFKGSGVSLCVEYGNDSFILGKAEETDISKSPFFTLRHENRMTVITLSCCNSCNTQLTVLSFASDKEEYYLSLESPYACETLIQTKGLSTGSILVIYLFVFTGIYFIGGAICLKFLRGATGWEMIPNHEFWRELPSLVKDGVVFTFNCFRVNSYERI